MTTQSSYNPKRRERRDLALFMLILIGTFACLMVAAQAAITQAGAWTVPANMLSELNPDTTYKLDRVAVEPLRPEVMTPPWSISRLLTPVGPGVVVPPLVPVATSPATATPLSPPAVPPSERDTPTPQPGTQTPTAVVGPTSTATLFPTATATHINTPAATATRVPPSATATRAPTRVTPTDRPDRPTRVPSTDVPPTRPSRASATPAP